MIRIKQESACQVQILTWLLLGVVTAQSLRCLLYKHEDPRSAPRTHTQKPGIVAMAWIPSAWEAETGGPMGLLLASLFGKL